MTCSAPARPSKHRKRRGLFTTLAIVTCLAVGTVGCLAVSPSTSSSAVAALAAGLRFLDSSGQEDLAEPTEADGVLPSGATAFDEELPGVARLDAELLSALRRATTDAADDEYQIQVSSGWRSATFQSHLLEQAIDEYGSAEEAARWVATAETSSHVSGEAVDIAPYDAIDWLSRHGDAYGLCQTYGNESWHFELRPEATEDGCPPAYPDATHDPRWQQ